MAMVDVLSIVLPLISLLTAICALAASITGWLRSLQKINELHIIMNSRLTELVQAVGDKRFLEGKLDQAC